MSNRSNDSKEVFMDALMELLNTIRAISKLIPLIVFACGWLTLGVINVASQHADITEVIVLMVILASTVLVYSQTRNYGESALALAAGLLTLFSVTWTTDKFIIFFVAWVAFTLFAIMISGVAAAKYEEVYKEAALAIDLSQPEENIKQVRQIIEGIKNKRLSQIQRAEIVRIFANRKLPLSTMQSGLEAVTTFYTISKANYETIALFVVDIYRMFSPIPEERYSKLLDQIFNVMRQSPVSPKEFIEAFNDSRRIALSENTEPEIYFERLQDALESGVSPAEMYEYLLENSPNLHPNLP